MSVRLLFIGLMVFLGVCFTAIALWLRISLKKSSAYGMRGAANNQTDTSKMKIGEIFFIYSKYSYHSTDSAEVNECYGLRSCCSWRNDYSNTCKSFFLMQESVHYNAIFSLAVLALLIVFLCFGYISYRFTGKAPCNDCRRDESNTE